MIMNTTLMRWCVQLKKVVPFVVWHVVPAHRVWIFLASVIAYRVCLSSAKHYLDTLMKYIHAFLTSIRLVKLYKVWLLDIQVSASD